MTRLKFLIPAVVAGAGLATFAVLLQLGATVTYFLFAVIGLGVVSGSVIRGDLLQRLLKRGVVVKVHETAVGAEQYDRPKPGDLVFGVYEWHEEWLRGDQPVRIVTRRTGVEVFLFKRLHKRPVVKISHMPDPMLQPHA